ncbi:unnamed protein product, partial [Strongylus vulgaris]
MNADETVASYGSLLGFDKEGNVISLQMIGRLDAAGLMPCTRNSDLYRMRIAESEGVMQIIRKTGADFTPKKY